MTADGLGDDLDTLQSRIDTVEALRTSPQHKPALEAELDCSRSTVTRAVRDLEDAGMLHRQDGGFALTLYGELLYQCYESFLDDAGDLAGARSLLRALPATAPLDPSFVAGATIRRSQPPAPYEPLASVDRLLECCSRFDGIAGRPPERPTDELLLDRVEAGLGGHLVLDGRLYDHLRARPSGGLRTLQAATAFDLFVTEEVPYELFVFDAVDDDRAPSTDGAESEPARAVLVVFDESGDLRGTITNDAPDAVEWAHDLIDRYRRRATPAPPADEPENETDGVG